MMIAADSFRLRNHHARADTLRAATTGTRRPLQRPPPSVGKFGEHRRGISASAIRTDVRASHAC